MQSLDKEVLTQHDLGSINTLVDYLASQKGFHRENAYYLLETEFGVSNVNHIKHCDLDRVISFLVALQTVTVH